MVEKLAPAGVGGGKRPSPFTLSTITNKAVMYAPAEMADTLLLFLLYLFILCVFTFQLVVAEEAVVRVVLAIQPRRGPRTSAQEASAAEDNQSNHLVEIVIISLVF